MEHIPVASLYPLNEAIPSVAAGKQAVMKAPEYTMDERARAVVLTVRNVRSYQGKGEIPNPDALREITGQMWRQRPIVEQAVLPEVARAMEESSGRYFGELIATHLDQMRADGKRVQYPSYMRKRETDDEPPRS